MKLGGIFSFSASQGRIGENDGNSGNDDKKSAWSKFKKNSLQWAINLVIASLLALIAQSIVIAFIADKLGIILSFIVSFLAALILLAALGFATGENNPNIGIPTVLILILLFIFRGVNLVGDHREAKTKEEEEIKKKSEVVVAPTPPPTVRRDTIALKFGRNEFVLRAGETTPVLAFPSSGCCRYEIDSEKRTYGVLVAGHNKIYGHEDIIPRTQDGTIRITVPEDDRVAIFLSPL